MPMVRKRALVLLAVVSTLAGSACSLGGGDSAGCEPSAVPDHDADTLVVEGDPWSGYAPFRDPDLLDGTGYDIVYVEQLCQEARAADLTTGRADIAVTTLDQYLLHQPDGTLVGVIDQSVGADALALNTVDFPYLESVDNLSQLVDEFERRGDRPVLAYTGSSPSEMLLNELANTTEELRPSDFELVSVDQSATAFQMMQDGEAQLAVIWEPDTSAASAAGYTIALSSRDVPDSIVDVIVASDRLLERDPDAVSAVLQSFYSTMDDYLADPEALQDFIADDGGLTGSEARAVLDGVQLYGTADADVFLNDEVFPLDQPQVEQSLDAIGSVLGLVHPEIRLDGAVVDGSYVEDLARDLPPDDLPPDD